MREKNSDAVVKVRDVSDESAPNSSKKLKISTGVTDCHIVLFCDGSASLHMCADVIRICTLCTVIDLSKL
jgi:hypothetical protein